MTFRVIWRGLSALACALAVTTTLLATPAVTYYQPESGGYMGGDFSDGNGYLHHEYTPGNQTSAVTEGELYANDVAYTRSCYGGAYDINQFTGEIVGVECGRWEVEFRARMTVDTNAAALPGHAGEVKALSRAKLLMWGNLNEDGWDACEVRNSNTQDPGHYDIDILDGGEEAHTIVGGGSAGELTVPGGPSAAMSSRIDVSWLRWRDAKDVQFSYESMSWGELVVEFDEPTQAGAICRSRHDVAGPTPPWSFWQVTVTAINMDVYPPQIIQTYDLE